MTIAGLYEKVQQLNTDRVIEQAFDDTSKQFAEANRDQMNDGIGRDGQKIGKYQNPAYARRKASLNPKPGYGNVDLRLTGAFQREIIVTANGDKVLTGSLDPKSPQLEAKYPNAFGLGGPYKAGYLANSLGPEIRRGITSVIGLTFG